MPTRFMVCFAYGVLTCVAYRLVEPLGILMLSFSACYMVNAITSLKP